MECTSTELFALHARLDVLPALLFLSVKNVPKDMSPNSQEPSRDQLPPWVSSAVLHVLHPALPAQEIPIYVPPASAALIFRVKFA